MRIDNSVRISRSERERRRYEEECTRLVSQHIYKNGSTYMDMSYCAILVNLCVVATPTLCHWPYSYRSLTYPVSAALCAALNQPQRTPQHTSTLASLREHRVPVTILHTPPLVVERSSRNATTCSHVMPPLIQDSLLRAAVSSSETGTSFFGFHVLNLAESSHMRRAAAGKPMRKR